MAPLLGAAGFSVFFPFSPFSNTKSRTDHSLLSNHNSFSSGLRAAVFLLHFQCVPCLNQQIRTSDGWHRCPSQPLAAPTLPPKFFDLQPVGEITEFQQYCGELPCCCKASSDLGDPQFCVGGMLFPGIFRHAKVLAKY